MVLSPARRLMQRFGRITPEKARLFPR